MPSISRTPAARSRKPRPWSGETDSCKKAKFSREVTGRPSSKMLVATEAGRRFRAGYQKET